MLQAITFDFWGTLYQDASARDERLHLLEEILARHGQPRSWATLEAAYQDVLSAWVRVWKEEHRSLPVDHWLQHMLDFLDAELPEGVVASIQRPFEEIYLRGDQPRPVAGVAEVLPRLARRYRLGLISDVGLTPGRILREILRRDGLLPHFQALTFSDETGATKPEPGQFLRTLDALDARPDKAAHVGDLPETDITGAHAAGMRAILFLGVSRRQDGRALADVVFEQYSELEALLERLE